MNTCSKVLSIALSLSALAFLPSAAAEQSASSMVQEVEVSQNVVVETIVKKQSLSVLDWPRTSGMEF